MVRISQVEVLTADCMKKQGFTYVPHVGADFQENDAGRYASQTSVLEPPDEVRKFRAKYGFGVLSRIVYPNDPSVAAPDINPAKNPNNAIHDRLDPARQKAYDLALNGVSKPGGPKSNGDTIKPGCAGNSYTQVFGDTKPDEAGAKAKQRAWAGFQNDPAAVAAAQKWADCLRGKGYKVKHTRPGEIETAAAELAMDGKLPAAAGDARAVPTDGAATAAAAGAKQIAPDVAKAGLDREIKAALADLDCSTDYATLVRTKYASVLKAGNGNG